MRRSRTFRGVLVARERGHNEEEAAERLRMQVCSRV